MKLRKKEEEKSLVKSNEKKKRNYNELKTIRSHLRTSFICLTRRFQY